QSAVAWRGSGMAALAWYNARQATRAEFARVGFGNLLPKSRAANALARFFLGLRIKNRRKRLNSLVKTLVSTAA
ncbi:MAG: hypothetical protein V3T80_10180, partial [Kiloniellales bacterium]